MQPGGTTRIRIGIGVLQGLPSLLNQLAAEHRIVVIADANLATQVELPLPDAIHLRFPAGEASKSREQWAVLTDMLLQHHCGRDTVIVALGGGVATDLGGFVAATFLRGIPWVAIPTSTLAMLDAAIGGKTGIDTPAGKNLVGAFHPPLAVLTEINLLATLPESRYREGLAEAVKHAAVMDSAYGLWMEEHGTAILARDPVRVASLVRRSVELKCSVVAEDPAEQGKRAILNAGHTVAHALELATDYAIPHGEAVALGLVLESRIAELRGIAADGTTDRVSRCLQAFRLPTTIQQGIDRKRIMAALIQDKKNRQGKVRATLLERFGAVARDQQSWTFPLDPEEIFRLLD